MNYREDIQKLLDSGQPREIERYVARHLAELKEEHGFFIDLDAPHYLSNIGELFRDVVPKFLPHFRLECNADTDYIETALAQTHWHCDIWVADREVACETALTANLAIILAAANAKSSPLKSTESQSADPDGTITKKE